MRIPKEFECISELITVDQVDTARLPDDYGQWISDQSKILIRKGCRRKLHTFIHECLHCWLEAIGRPDLSADETFVDLLADVITQMLLTKR